MATTIMEKSRTGIATSGPTPLGHFAVGVVNGVLVAVAMGRPSDSAARQYVTKLLREREHLDLEPTAEDDELAAQLVERLVDYASGALDSFADVETSLDGLSRFQRRVVNACRKIPHGQTRTYGDLAAAAGSPGAARAVGQVMASNRVPVVVPCHRVVAAGGRLGGFSAPQGVSLKRRMLDMEAGS